MAILETLTEAEAAEMGKLESTLGQDLEAFHGVGKILLRIREGRLHRATHTYFEEYCQERWGLDRIYVKRILDAVKIR